MNPQLQSLSTAMAAANSLNQQQLQAMNSPCMAPPAGQQAQNMNVPLQPKSPKSPGVAQVAGIPTSTGGVRIHETGYLHVGIDVGNTFKLDELCETSYRVLIIDVQGKTGE